MTHWLERLSTANHASRLGSSTTRAARSRWRLSRCSCSIWAVMTATDRYADIPWVSRADLATWVSCRHGHGMAPTPTPEPSLWLWPQSPRSGAGRRNTETTPLSVHSPRYMRPRARSERRDGAAPLQSMSLLWESPEAKQLEAARRTATPRVRSSISSCRRGEDRHAHEDPIVNPSKWVGIYSVSAWPTSPHA